MKAGKSPLIKLVSILAALTLVSACAATYTKVRYADLQVQNKMSKSIFLDPVAPAQRTVFVQVRNTSDKPFNLQQEVVSALMSRGYKVVEDPNKAHYLLQANVLSVALQDKAAAEESRLAGFGGVVAGAVLGALVGGRGGRGWGAAVGGVAGAAAETISGAAVKVVQYTVVTDMQISERDGTVSQQFISNLKQGTADTTIRQRAASAVKWRRYQTRIVSTARKADLAFEEAYPFLRHGISQAIAGVM
ncbi:MAG: complement resistance protein TraT [Desulfarculaceae bacterium]|jgi:hypothetical protein